MTTQEIETRVESLERGMRRWRRLASVLVVGLVVAGTLAATRQEEIPDVVKARQFRVVNKAGNDVVSLKANKDGAGVLVAYYENGMGAVRMGNGRLSISDKTLQPLVEMGRDKNGNGSFSTLRKDGGPIASLGVIPTGEGLMVVYRKDGKALAGLGVDASRKPNGPNGKLNGNGVGGLWVANKDGMPFVGLAADPNGNGGLWAMDGNPAKAGKPVWLSPIK